MSIDFWGLHGSHPFLSNFYGSPFILDGKQYSTVEHFFQSQKFAGTKYEEYIRCLETPAEAAREGKRRDLPLRKDWEEVKEGVMYKGLIAKFTQNPALQIALLATKGEMLREVSPYDRYWGTGRDQTGKNRLGVLLVRLRDEYFQ